MECAFHNISLIPKWNRELRDIGLVEVICKAVPGVVNCRIGEAVYFHNTLHRFRAGRGMGTASLEVKLI